MSGRKAASRRRRARIPGAGPLPIRAACKATLRGAEDDGSSCLFRTARILRAHDHERAGCARSGRPSARVPMTWSIIFHERAKDGSVGRIAIAVATKFFAVGARVPHIEPQKGAVCTQALLNPLYGPHGLRLIRERVGAADVVRILTTPDAGREHRQLHVMGADGKFAAHTGAECVPWCGHWIGEDMSVAGNMLAGPQVISETVRVLRERSDLELPRRLITALKAGEKVGGDKRGKQSAALVIW